MKKVSSEVLALISQGAVLSHGKKRRRTDHASSDTDVKGACGMHAPVISRKYVRIRYGLGISRIV